MKEMRNRAAAAEAAAGQLEDVLETQVLDHHQLRACCLLHSCFLSLYKVPPDDTERTK
jgi:hypothetical protein